MKERKGYEGKGRNAKTREGTKMKEGKHMKGRKGYDGS